MLFLQALAEKKKGVASLEKCWQFHSPKKILPNPVGSSANFYDTPPYKGDWMEKEAKRRRNTAN